MRLSQEDKITKIFKAKKLKINDIVKNNFAGKGSYYNQIRKEPLDEDFISLIKSNYGIDLVQELKAFEQEDESGSGLRKEDLAKELIIINRKYQELLEKGNADKDKIIELMAKVSELEKKINTGT